MSYLAMAYRWGALNEHYYVIYAGDDQHKAIAMANSECANRGGKYGCVVWKFTDASDGEQDRSIVSYFPSTYGEEAPTHNHRIDMFQSLGHIFKNFADGTVYLPEDDPTMKHKDGTPMRVLKPHKMEPPQWVKDESKRAQDFCDAIETMKRSQNEAPTCLRGIRQHRGIEGGGMSGGAFNYACFWVDAFADDLGHKLDNADKENEWGEKPDHFEPATLEQLREIEAIARYTARLMKEAEWLYSGDNGDTSFMRNVAEIQATFSSLLK